MRHGALGHHRSGPGWVPRERGAGVRASAQCARTPGGMPRGDGCLGTAARGVPASACLLTSRAFDLKEMLVQLTAALTLLAMSGAIVNLLATTVVGESEQYFKCMYTSSEELGYQFEQEKLTSSSSTGYGTAKQA